MNKTYIDILMYSDHRYRNFLNSEQAKCYEDIFHISCEYVTEKDLAEIGRKHSTVKKCIFFSNDEPHWYDKGASVSLQFNKFMELCRQHQIFNVDFYVPCFSDMHRDAFKIMNNNYFNWNFITYDVDLISFGDNSAVSLLDKNFDRDDLQLEQIKYKFLHMNRTHRMHRQLFSKFLIQKNMFAENCVAINLENNLNADVQTSPIENVYPGCINVDQNDDWPMNKSLAELWRDTKLSQHSNPDIDQLYWQSHYDFIEKAGFYIVSETVFHHPYPHFTEKMTSALLSGRPFIVIGPSGSLRTLKSKGYKTFDNVVDESYDGITDPSSRMEVIFKIVEELNNRPLDQIKQNVSQSRDRVMHNRRLTLDRLKRFKKSFNQDQEESKHVSNK